MDFGDPSENGEKGAIGARFECGKCKNVRKAATTLVLGAEDTDGFMNGNKKREAFSRRPGGSGMHLEFWVHGV